MIGASISVPKSLGSQNSSDDTPPTFLPHPIIPENYSELETFITKISGENERFNAVQEYFEKTNPIDFGRKNKGFAKKEFILLLRACESCSLFENRIQSTSEFRILRSALQDLVEQKIEVLTTILSHLDSTINFFKIVDCLKAKDANVKSEAIEVLKGVLGPKNTDTFVNLITPAMREQDQESVGVERILKQFSTESNPSIVKGVLLTLSKETFAQGKAFITSCFNHHDYAVRESALKAFLSLEAEPSEIRKYCEILSDDNSSIISTIAKEKIQSILNP